MGRLLKPDGERIRSLRMKKGWPREQLAQIAGVSVRTIRRVEAGSTASFEALRAIAGAFGLEVHELMRGLPGRSSSRPAMTARMFSVMSAESVTAVMAWCMPYAPAAKGLMATFALIVLAASAIALSPLLVERDEDSIIVASSQSLLPTQNVIPTGSVGASFQPPPRKLAASKYSMLRAARTENAPLPGGGSATAADAATPAKTPVRHETPAADHASDAAPLHTSSPGGTVQAIAGMIHTDWLRNLAQPVSTPTGFFGGSHSKSAQKVPATVSEAHGGGYSVLGKPFVRSGKTTAAFLAKVGTSIKRAF